MTDKIKEKLLKEIEEKTNALKNCGFEYNNYTKVEGKLITEKYICGKDSETCPHCKNKIVSNTRTMRLKLKQHEETKKDILEKIEDFKCICEICKGKHIRWVNKEKLKEKLK